MFKMVQTWIAEHKRLRTTALAYFTYMLLAWRMRGVRYAAQI
jgi:hypothetical protein